MSSTLLTYLLTLYWPQCPVGWPACWSNWTSALSGRRCWSARVQFVSAHGAFC